MTPTEVDVAILNAVGRYPKKVAMIIGLVGKLAESAQGDDSFDLVESRIAALVKAGKLEAFGDITNWRHSEIGPPQ